MSSSQITPPRAGASFDDFAAMIGAGARPSDWLLVDQARIDGFARDTGDDAFIHVDPERAAQTRFGGTIAHGLLSLSLLPYLMRSAMPYPSESRMGVNYGFDRVRFITPVPVDRRVRAHVTVEDVSETKPSFVVITHGVELELEGADKPALTARWLLGHWVNR